MQVCSKNPRVHSSSLHAELKVQGCERPTLSFFRAAQPRPPLLCSPSIQACYRMATRWTSYLVSKPRAGTEKVVGPAFPSLLRRDCSLLDALQRVLSSYLSW